MATSNLSVLFVASEAEGLIKSGGLADVARALPETLVELEQDARLVIPAYSAIDGLADDEVVLESQLDFWPHTSYQVKQRMLGDLPVYLIACAAYFD